MESQQVLVGAPATAAVASEQTQKFSLFALTMMVVGSMVGAGIWSLPRPFATATGVFGAIIAWLIAAGGMYSVPSCSKMRLSDMTYTVAVSIVGILLFLA
jgi:hypothetical protein